MTGFSARERYRVKMMLAMRNPHHPKHGTETGYRDGQCRCDRCSRAHSRSVSRYRAAQRKAVAA